MYVYIYIYIYIYIHIFIFWGNLEFYDGNFPLKRCGLNSWWVWLKPNLYCPALLPKNQIDNCQSKYGAESITIVVK